MCQYGSSQSWTAGVGHIWNLCFGSLVQTQRGEKRTPHAQWLDWKRRSHREGIGMMRDVVGLSFDERVRGLGWDCMLASRMMCR